MKLGYLGNSNDYKHPADRRRFCYFAKKEKLHFDNADLQIRHDCLIFSIASNFFDILEYKKKFPETTLIFDYCDDLLSDSMLKRIIRPFYEALKWKNLNNFTNYNELVIATLKNSDKVICGSHEQKSNLLKFNKNINVIPDFVVTESVFKKKTYELVESPKVNIVWEGLSGGFSKIKHSLIKLAKSIDNEIILNIVTDKTTYMIGDRYFKKDTKSILKKLSKKYKIEINFWEWSKLNLNEAIKKSDLAIIYIPSNDITMQNKPENKLVLLSSFAIPVLVSGTPSYKRFLKSAGGKEFCMLATQPNKNIKQLCRDTELRKKIGTTIYSYASTAYSEEKILLEWKNLLKTT